MFGLIFN